MTIKINDIPPEGLTIEIKDSLDLFDTGTAATPFTAMVKIHPVAAGAFHVSGAVSTVLELECSRCLRSFPFPLQDTAMDFDLFPEGSLQTGADHELGRGELDTEFYQGDAIEPRELIREQLLLAIPMVPVHREDCKGLCPVCGADRNERKCGCTPDTLPGKENPFAVLKKIIKPEKE